MRDVIALDVSKNHSYCVWYHGHECIHECEIDHDKTGFNELLTLVKHAWNPVVYFEATGVYSRGLQSFCENNSLDYVRLNPLELHLFSESLRRVKTDQSDAHKIAKTVMENSFRLTSRWSPVYSRLRELNRFLKRLNDDIKLKKVTLLTELQQTFPEEEKLFSSKTSQLQLNVIYQYPHPDLVSNISRTCLKNQLLNQTAKKISKNKALKYAKKLLNLAQQSYPACDVNSVQVDEVRYYCRALIELFQEKQRLIDKMETLAHQLPDYDIYQSVPGIGPQSAVQLMAELGDIRRFDNANQLNAFIGTDLNRYQSGSYLRTDHINKRGNPNGRALLFLIVTNMIKQQATAPNHIVDYYYRLKKRPTPKRNKVAIVACMNRTLKCLYAMIMAGTKYVYPYADSKSHLLE